MPGCSANPRAWAVEEAEEKEDKPQNKADLMQPRRNSPCPNPLTGQRPLGTQVHLYSFSWPEHRPPLKSSLSKLKDRGQEVTAHHWYELAPPPCKCRRQDGTQEVRVLDYLSSHSPERKGEAPPTCPAPLRITKGMGGRSADSRITSQTGLPGQPSSVLSGQLKPSLGLLSQCNQGHKVLLKLGIRQSNDRDAIRITGQRGRCQTRASWWAFLPQSHRPGDPETPFSNIPG